MKSNVFTKFLLLSLAVILITACGGKKEDKVMEAPQDTTVAHLQALVNQWAPVKITADLSGLTERERMLIEKLAEAGHICDSIFWYQSCKDGSAIRDSLAELNTDESNLLLKLVNIYYGPYDKMNGYKRFVGDGPTIRPEIGGFYPDDMTKEEFESHVKNNPKDKAAFESWYTVIVRDSNKNLKAVSYYEYYPQMERLAVLLDEAAELCDNPSLKKYLVARAKSIRTNNYFPSDWLWMDLKDNKIDVVIGPIESYEDGMFNYKTAFETVVMVKDEQGTKELEMFKENISNFQKHLPWDKKYYVEAKQGGTILQMMNVVYFGGDCNKASKTIAAALPNDPNVYEKKGGKKSMYKNLMEAKFDNILKPIADIMIAPDMLQYVSRDHMVSFVTLHEVSHNLGRGFVYKNEKLGVKSALKEKYSATEELKADICAMHNLKVLLSEGKYTNEDLKKSMITYVAGLFRSMRFGAEDAHGVANFIQFRYLVEKGGIYKDKDGKYSVNEEKFFAVVEELAKLVLEIQARGDYNAASELIKKYGDSTPEIMNEFNKVKSVPIDLDAMYMY